VTLTSDDVGGIPDFGALIAAQPDGTAVHCCGREPMIGAVEGFAAACPSVTLHTERFAASEKSADPGAGGETPSISSCVAGAWSWR
jgi:ferredoxin-NADP reductase